MNPLALLESPAGFALPAIIERAGKGASLRFLEFFTVNIRNPNTRAAYGCAAGAFLHWCEESGIAELRQVQPVHVAAYIEQLGCERSAPTVKQHLACLRMLFDWLVTGQVMPSNPSHAVRGPRHSVSKGATPVISSGRSPRAARQHGHGYRGRPARSRAHCRHGFYLRTRHCCGRSQGGRLLSANTAVQDRSGL